eukprot:8695929-Alexandrium_andersonii.AAC.1
MSASLVGSEMCIRDRIEPFAPAPVGSELELGKETGAEAQPMVERFVGKPVDPRGAGPTR